MAGSPHLTAECNYQKAFRNLFCHTNVATVFSFPLGIKYLHEKVNVVGYFGTCIQLT